MATAEDYYPSPNTRRLRIFSFDPALAARHDLEAGVLGEPDCLPVVLPGSVSGWSDEGALAFPAAGVEKVAVGHVQIRQRLFVRLERDVLGCCVQWEEARVHRVVSRS
jgi:hypothetical protein